MAIQSKLLTEDLVDYTLGLGHESIPPEVLDKTKQLFLDYLGVAFGGRRFAEASPSIMGAVNDLSNGQRGPCTVVGDGERFPSHYAALLNGAFAHAMDFDDTHRDAVMHPGAPVFSTLMAVAEENGYSGRDLLTAAVAGYDVANKLGKAVKGGIHKRGLHPTATTGIFAATVAAAKLLGLSRDEAINAMGINVSQAAGSQQFVEFGGWNKPFHVGMAAHNAIFALTLARRGFLGASSPLEGRFGYFFSYSANGWDPAEIAGLGTEFEVMYTGIKPYPCCRYNHSVIGAVRDLVQEHRLSPGDIASMDVYINPVGPQYRGRARRPEAKTHDASVGTVQRVFRGGGGRCIRGPKLANLRKAPGRHATRPDERHEHAGLARRCRRWRAGWSLPRRTARSSAWRSPIPRANLRTL